MDIQLVRREGGRACDHLTLHEAGELAWLGAPLLEREGWLAHGFSTRLGGVSTGETGSMNLGFAREEDKENVRENYRRIAAAIGFEPERLVFTWQTHTANIRTVREEDAGLGFIRERTYQDVDGLVTNVPGITLACFAADCVPILAADPQHHAVGCAHSGWRGTVSDIAGALIRRMQAEYGTDPEKVVTAIGPSICGDCYEVDADVAQRFLEAYPAKAQDRIVRSGENGKYYIGLWEAVRYNLLRAGLREDRVSLPDLCTKCNPRLLFSHRVQRGRQGLHAGFIGVRNRKYSRIGRAI